ncbi:MAG TPA: uracil-DNA glycosylase family protein [Kineosporiaceae bacterium]|nr:uracil-DNA glycosylase family protein [Kineosporiaceae bacterium]
MPDPASPARPFCPGYDRAPFDALAAAYPGADTYPAKDFRLEWGPIFHRGRLDGTARVLVLGQDPATHEAISRRILVGEAGQRVQGLLAKVGLSTGYVLVNTFLYSVYGQGGGERHADDPAIAAYRDQWLDALLAGGTVTAVVTLGTLARKAYQAWAATRPDVAGGLHLAAIRHPTWPESASASGSTTWEKATAALLEDWNAHLPALHEHVVPETPTELELYGETWKPGDLVEIPAGDLPAGTPAWWRALEPWADRTGRTSELKRATITVTVPAGARPWHQ